MPTFYEECEFDITPDEYFAECNERDRETLKDIVIDHFDLYVPEEEEEAKMSIPEQEFFHAMRKLSTLYRSVSKGDEDILMNMAKRYV